MRQDADHDPLTFRLLQASTFGTVEGVLPHLTYLAPAHVTGQGTLVFVVNDGQADSAPATVTRDLWERVLDLLS